MGNSPLISTTSAAGLGAYAIPLTRAQFVHLLAAGTPCEIPRPAMFSWLRHLEKVASRAEVNVACNATIAQVRPVKVTLKDGAAI